MLEGRMRTVAELRVMVEVPAGMRPGPPPSQPKQIEQPQLVRARARATEQPDERRAVGQQRFGAVGEAAWCRPLAPQARELRRVVIRRHRANVVPQPTQAAQVGWRP